VLAALGAGAWWYTQPKPVAPPPPPPPPAAPPAPDNAAALAARLDTVEGAGLMAWTQLLARWQVSSSEVGVADAARCQPQVFPGFDCLRGHATLDQLARFDRPLILELESGGKSGLALLRGIGAEKVQLDFAGVSHTLTRDELARVWQGGFAVAWRLPDDVPARLKLGDSGTGVGWVKRQLARHDGHADAGFGPATYDAALEDRVRKLQTAYGLNADGIVGPETLFALAALSPEGPHLARNVE
jgi:general secretion pathway protein A